jgi:hypothetical protein
MYDGCMTDVDGCMTDVKPPKSRKQYLKVETMSYTKKHRKPLYLLGISDVYWEGARRDSNP